VRRDAKASSAGSNEGTGNGRGLFRRAFATRGVLSDSKGSGASAGVRSTFAVLALSALALALSASSALGAYQYNLETTFGAGQSSGAKGMAIDYTDGDIWVSAKTHFNKYTEQHALEGQEAPDDQILTYPGFEGFPTSYSQAWGVAVDPANGNVYASDLANEGSFHKYDAAGDPLPFNFNDGKTRAIQPGGVAVNPSNSHVYLGDNYIGPMPVWELNANGEATGNSYIAPAPILGVAIDSAGNVYAALGSAGTVKFTAPGTTYTTFTTDTSTGIAINPVDQHVFITSGDAVAEYDTSGTRVSDFFGVGPLKGSYGVAVNAAATHFFVADGGGSSYVFDRVSVADTASKPASSITRTSATVAGHVDPAGAGKITDCFFEYGKAGSYEASVPCSEGTEFAAPADVSAPLTSLAYETVYQYRVVAIDANGSKHSIEAKFKTLPAVKGLSTDPATELKNTAALLNGSLDPNGESTSYHFEYISDAEYQTTHYDPITNTEPINGFKNAASTPVPDADAGEAVGSKSVSAAISGLSAVTTYHFRIVAQNALGKTVAPEQTFTTKPAVESLSTAPATEVTTDSAQLHGFLDPNGEEAQYRFEYETDAEWQTWGFGNATKTPVPDASAGVTPGLQELSAAATGLQPNATYHARIVAHNPTGTTYGNEQQFHTGGVPPVIVEQGSTPTYTEAEMRAKINPSNEVTTYHFEYGATESYGKSTTAIKIPPGYQPVKVHDQALALIAGNTYHFRVVASNGSGEVIGLDQTFTTVNYPSTVDNCPNAALRAAQHSAALPECRAYEQVSPVHKAGVGVDRTNTGFRASPDGNAIAYGTEKGSLEGTNGAPYVPRNLAVRTADDWTTTALDLPGNNFKPGFDYFFNTIAVSPDLTRALSLSTQKLTPDAVEGTWNAYIQEPATGKLTLLATSDLFSHLAAQEGNYQQIGTSANLEVLSWGDGFGPQYEARIGKGVQIASVLPNGEFSKSNAGGVVQQLDNPHQVSEDGSRIFVTVGNQFPGETGLYVRENGETTKVISVSRRPGDSTEPKRGNFEWASPDGRFVEFSCASPLTVDAPPGGGHYRYDVDTDTLTYLATPDNPRGKRFSAFEGPGKYGGAGDVYLHDEEDGTDTCVSCRPDERPNAAPAMVNHGNSGSAFNRWFSNVVTEDGRVFFDTTASLVPRDANGNRDVYVYHEGQVALLSAGKSNASSQIQEVTPDGRDVFIVTSDRLVGQDQDTTVDLYDVRVDGGLAGQSPPPPKECIRDDCKATPNAGPELPFGGSEGLTGPGNVEEPAKLRCGNGRHKVKTRGKARCVKNHKPHGNRRQGR
jgi:hypothetical protein